MITGSLKNHTHQELLPETISNDRTNDTQTQYIKFPDGTLFCIAKMWFQRSLTKDSNHIIKDTDDDDYMTWWSTGDHKWYQDATQYYINLNYFIEKPMAFAQLYSGYWESIKIDIMIIDDNSSKNRLAFSIYDNNRNKNTGDFYVQFLIIGRWK